MNIERLAAIPYYYKIKTKNDALLYHKNNNYFIRDHCSRILKGQRIIRKVKEFYLGQKIAIWGYDYIIHYFPSRYSACYVISENHYLSSIISAKDSISGLRKLISEQKGKNEK